MNLVNNKTRVNEEGQSLLLRLAFPNMSRNQRHEEAAKVLGCHKNTVYNYDEGYTKISFQDAAKLGALAGYEAFLRAAFGEDAD